MSLSVTSEKFNMLILSRLKGISESSLPGVRSHLKMAPDLRKKDIILNHNNHCTIDSAVLIAFYIDNSTYKTVLIKRPEYDGVHSGQISFPGGKREQVEPLHYTALREAKEEVGIKPDDVNIIAQLTPLYIPPSRYLVYPFIGLLENKPNLIADASEVAEIVEVDLSYFLDDKNIKYENVKLSEGFVASTPCYIYDDKIIWGATAMIISELVDVIRTNGS